MTICHISRQVAPSLTPSCLFQEGKNNSRETVWFGQLLLPGQFHPPPFPFLISRNNAKTLLDWGCDLHRAAHVLIRDSLSLAPVRVDFTCSVNCVHYVTTTNVAIFFFLKRERWSLPDFKNTCPTVRVLATAASIAFDETFNLGGTWRDEGT